jgi:SAM-dependent methyltransferase
MAHKEQKVWCESIKEMLPSSFQNKKVLDVGCLDINGNNRYLFQNCEYTGIDVAPGPNVDIVSLGHEYNAPDNTFDTIISTECFEHDMFFPKTFMNIVRMLKPGGLFMFTAGGIGRGEHGTLRTDGGFSSPLTSKIPGWENYYRNVDVNWVKSFCNIEETFTEHQFSYEPTVCDIRFWGIKK